MQQIIEFYGKMAVVVRINQRSEEYAMPNFRGTGKALQGFLLPLETLEGFNIRRAKRFKQLMKINDRLDFTNK